MFLSLKFFVNWPMRYFRRSLSSALCTPWTAWLTLVMPFTCLLSGGTKSSPDLTPYRSEIWPLTFGMIRFYAKNFRAMTVPLTWTRRIATYLTRWHCDIFVNCVSWIGSLRVVHLVWFNIYLFSHLHSVLRISEANIISVKIITSKCILLWWFLTCFWSFLM